MVLSTEATPASEVGLVGLVEPHDDRPALRFLPTVHTKGQIALELLDQVRAEGLPGRVVIADSGYGVVEDFRAGLAERGLLYLARVTAEMVVFPEAPVWVTPQTNTGGRPQNRHWLAEGAPRPVSLKELAARTRLRKVTWREGTKGKLAGRFAWLRVWPGQGWSTGACASAEPTWLLIEEQADGKLKYAFSNLPADTRRIRAVRLWKRRWPVETCQADSTSSDRWCEGFDTGYDQRRCAA